MRWSKGLCLLFSFLCLTPLLLASPVDDWQPITKDDLTMKEYAPSPGAHAVILWRSDHRDDTQGTQTRFYRIKVLDELGKAAADVETEGYYSIIKFGTVEARLIQPDGTIIPYTGPITDKLVAKYKNFQAKAKRFSIPDVRVGSIIDYRYTITWDRGYEFPTTWRIQSTYPTRHLEFWHRFKTDRYLNFTWMYRLLPSNVQPASDKGVLTLTMDAVPAAEVEPMMPPEAEVRPSVLLEYRNTFTPSIPADFWDYHAKAWYQAYDYFLLKKGAAQRYINTWTNPAESPETRLRKLYAGVQGLRNLSYEPSKTDKELKELKTNEYLDDVLKHGYGYHNELVRAFVGLASAAGFDASLLRVAERDTYFHHPEILSAAPYQVEIAVVKLDGTEHFLDPGIPFCPFGMLPWEDTAAFGMRMNKGTILWQKTPEPVATESTTRRIAEFEVNEDGTLTGTLTVSYEGRFALYERLSKHEDDDTQKTKDIKEIVQGWLPAGSKVELTNVDDWNAVSDKFVIKAKVTIPDYATSTGKRMMVPISPFTGSDQHSFQASKRLFPVYLREPYRTFDEITLRLPEGMELESIPKARSIPIGYADLFMTVRRDGASLKVNRQVTINSYYIPIEQYPSFREFLERVRLVGEEQAVLHALTK